MFVVVFLPFPSYTVGFGAEIVIEYFDGGSDLKDPPRGDFLSSGG